MLSLSLSQHAHISHSLTHVAYKYKLFSSTSSYFPANLTLRDFPGKSLPPRTDGVFLVGEARPELAVATATVLIFTRLGAVEILKSAQRVCSSWFEICKDLLLWRTIDMRNLSSLSQWSFLLLNLKAMCRRAVDRSSGELVEISLEDSATSELLMYIAER